MTREEFAAAVESVRAGEQGATLKLWEGSRRVIAKYAYKWARGFGERVLHEDLMQTGFLALLDAVEKFNSTREDSSFLSVLRLALKTHFSEECCVRTTKRDALQFAESSETPTYEDGPTVADTVPDARASLAFIGVEYREFMRYCRGIISTALKTVMDQQAIILRLHYLDGMTLEDITEMRGLSSKQAASETEERALNRLACGKYRRELRECLDTLEDFRADRDATKADLWSIGRTEKAALLNITKEGKTP